MNIKQVAALHDLMKRATGAVQLATEVGALDVHVSLQVVQGVDNGNTYEAKLWTPSTTLLRFPEPFYLRDDGKVYVWDNETQHAHEMRSVSWRALGKYSYELHVEAAEEVLV